MNLEIASIEEDWGSAVAPGEVDVADFPALKNIAVEAGDELIWSYRAAALTAPDTDYYMRDQPLTLALTGPAPANVGAFWQQY